MTRTYRRLLATLPMLGILSWSAHVPAARHAAAASGVRRFTLPWTGRSQRAPSISGHRVVWAYAHAPYQNLTATDLSTGRTTPVVTDGMAITAPFGPPSPSVGGQLVVWMDCRICSTKTYADQMFPDGTRIYAHNLATGRTFPVARTSDTQTFAAVSNGWIVWTGQRARNSRHIYARDPATGRVSRLSPPSGDQTAPSISWPIVVWQELRDRTHGNWDIAGTDLRTGQAVRVAVHPRGGDDIEDPLVSGNTVIWMHWHADRSLSIDGKDLATGRTFQVVRLRSDQVNPQLGVHAAIDRSLVAWDQARRAPYVPGEADIYVRDLATGRTLRLTDDGTDNAWPAVAGHVIIWEQWSNGKGRIAGAVLQ